MKVFNLIAAILTELQNSIDRIKRVISLVYFKYLTSTGLILLIGQLSIAQNLDWAKSASGVDFTLGRGITVDQAGNVYTVGSFLGTVDFDPGPGTSYLTSPPSSSGGFVMKLDSDGNFIFAKAFDGSAICASIFVDADQNIYLSGFYTSTVDFDPGVGVFNITSAHDADVFICKLDSQGNFVLALSLGGVGSDGWPNPVCVDGQGNIYATGTFSGINDFDPGPGTYNLTTGNTNYRIFVVKINALGELLYAYGIGENGSGKGASIHVDSDENVYVTGTFEGTVDFDPGPAVTNLTSSGYADIFMLKLDASGNHVYSKALIGSGSNGGISTIDAAGNLYLTGSFQASLDFDPSVGTHFLTSVGSSDAFACKFDSGGNLIWANSFGGLNAVEGTDVAIDSEGNVYIVGNYLWLADFDPDDSITYNINSNGSRDAYVSKLSPSGDFVYALGLGGLNSETGRGIALGPNGEVHVTGSFQTTADFDPTGATYNLTTYGSDEVYICKFGQSETGVNGVKNVEFSIFPNPFTESITIDLAKNRVYTHAIIYDLLGRELTKLTVQGDRKLTWDSKDQPNGVYVVSLFGENEVKSIKVVKK